MKQLYALLLLIAPAAFGMARSPKTATLPQIEERERVADEKRRENNPSADDEYAQAIALAETAAESAGRPLRDALLLLESPGGPGMFQWRQSAEEFLLRMSPEERYFFRARVQEMPETEREADLRWLSSSGVRDALLSSLDGALEEWRGLRTASARMREKCGSGCQ